MAAITGICGKRFETMADFVRHLVHCPFCAFAARRRAVR